MLFLRNMWFIQEVASCQVVVYVQIQSQVKRCNILLLSVWFNIVPTSPSSVTLSPCPFTSEWYNGCWSPSRSNTYSWVLTSIPPDCRMLYIHSCWSDALHGMEIFAPCRVYRSNGLYGRWMYINTCKVWILKDGGGGVEVCRLKTFSRCFLTETFRGRYVWDGIGEKEQLLWCKMLGWMVSE